MGCGYKKPCLELALWGVVTKWELELVPKRDEMQSCVPSKRSREDYGLVGEIGYGNVYVHVLSQLVIAVSKVGGFQGLGSGETLALH